MTSLRICSIMELAVSSRFLQSPSQPSRGDLPSSCSPRSRRWHKQVAHATSNARQWLSDRRHTHLDAPCNHTTPPPSPDVADWTPERETCHVSCLMNSLNQLKRSRHPCIPYISYTFHASGHILPYPTLMPANSGNEAVQKGPPQQHPWRNPGGRCRSQSPEGQENYHHPEATSRCNARRPLPRWASGGPLGPFLSTPAAGLWLLLQVPVADINELVCVCVWPSLAH